MDEHDSDTIHSQYAYGRLVLWCGPAAFERLKSHLLPEISLEDVAETGIHAIEINIVGPSHESHRRPWLRDRITLVGCGVVIVLFLLVFIMGIVTIVNAL